MRDFRPAGGADEEGLAESLPEAEPPPFFSGALALMGVGGWLMLFAAVLLLRQLW